MQQAPGEGLWAMQGGSTIIRDGLLGRSCTSLLLGRLRLFKGGCLGVKIQTSTELAESVLTGRAAEKVYLSQADLSLTHKQCSWHMGIKDVKLQLID